MDTNSITTVELEKSPGGMWYDGANELTLCATVVIRLLKGEEPERIKVTLSCKPQPGFSKIKLLSKAGNSGVIVAYGRRQVDGIICGSAKLLLSLVTKWGCKSFYFKIEAA